MLEGVFETTWNARAIVVGVAVTAFAGEDEGWKYVLVSAAL